MPALSLQSRRACGFGLALAVCASCATQLDEGLAPPGGLAGAGGTGGAGAGGMPGEAGKSSMPQAGGGAAGAPVAGSGGASSGAGGVGTAGNGGMASAGTASGGGAGGAGGGGGAGGKSSGGSGGKATGGTGGSGGAGGLATCAKNPIPSKASWTLTASHSQPNGVEPVTNAKDGILTNRWATGKPQAGDEWLQVDFGVTVTLTKVTLVLGSSPDDYPRQYAARLSGSSQNVGAPVLDQGMGAQNANTVLDFPAGSVGRYLLISQSGTAAGLWWSVAEIQAECAD